MITTHKISNSIATTLPEINFGTVKSNIDSINTNINYLFGKLTGSKSNTNLLTNSTSYKSKFRNRMPKKQLLIAVLIIVIATFAVLVVIKRNKNNNVTTSTNESTQSSDNSEGENILAELTLDTYYSFTAYDSNGQKSENVNLHINKAEKTKEVLVQGRPANAKGDKAFLVLSLEIENTQTYKLYLKPVDLIRLVDSGDKKFAPDIHSDLVEIQPISTKMTRIGFVIEENQQKFNLQIGELDGEKSTLEVNF